MPPGTSHVLDFTAEFPGDKNARRTVKWLSIPVLDGCAPKPADYRKGFTFLDGSPEPIVYVCCAKGRGRSATFASALLLKKGIAHTPEVAIATVETQRYRASLNNGQIKSLERGDWR
jgi:protein-tyrosine phosphatase